MKDYFCRDCETSWKSPAYYGECVKCGSANLSYEDRDSEDVDNEYDENQDLDIYEVGNDVPQMSDEEMGDESDE